MLLNTSLAIPQRPSALSLLFAHYLSGEIGDACWTRLMNVLDTDGTTADEREAMAMYFAEVVDETASVEDLPGSNEVQDILLAARGI